MDLIENPSGNDLNQDEIKTPLQKVGSFLREGRQSRNISVEDLSNSLRIGKEQLEALENGQENSLPEKVFIKAMIRRISDKLGLDTTFVLKELQGRDIKVKINNLYERKQSEQQKKDYKILFPWIIIISGLLGLFCSIPVINYFKNLDSNPNSKTTISKQITLEK